MGGVGSIKVWGFGGVGFGIYVLVGFLLWFLFLGFCFGDEF